MKIAGVILAGGKGLRMAGANKALQTLGGKPLYQHVVDRLTDQTALIGINANRDLEAFDLPIIADGLGGDLGPLDGILGALNFAREHSCTHVLTVSVDTPFIPLDLVQKLCEIPRDQIAVASSLGRIHGTSALWPVDISAGLKSFILAGKSLKLMDYLNQAQFAAVAFSGQNPDPFFNINTPGDLAAASGWL